MGSIVGFLFGVGVSLIWWSRTIPRPTKTKVRDRGRVRDFLNRAGWRSVQPSMAVVGLIAIGLVAAAIASLAVGSPVIGVCFGLLCATVPIFVGTSRIRQRQTQRRELWPDVVDNLASGIRAGLTLPEAVSNVSTRGPVELRPFFQEFAQDYRVSGQFSPSLDRLKDRLADPVADRIIEALRLTRDVGGTDLGALLRTLSAFLREDARVRAELESRQSWTTNAARLAVAAPWAVLALLCTRPEAVDAFNSATGAVVLGVGAAVCVIAYSAMTRIGRLPQERRVLQ